MKYLRMLLASVSLIAMTALFVIPGAAVCAWLDWLPRAQLVPAILAGEFIAIGAIAVSVLLCGRLYCSLVCPLGIAQDLSRRVFRLCRLGGTVLPPAFPVVRWIVLALFVAGAFFGFAGFIAPYGIFGRFLSAGVMRFGEPPVLVVVWAIALFAFILGMTSLRARWWCNQICPVGTLLGFGSRFAFFRVRIDRSKCVACGLCAGACDKGAIVRTGKEMKVDPSLCVTCMNCKGSCTRGALRFKEIA